ncbi:LpxL/LpxP family acyltransferase [Methylobacterium persicinum]|uniref:KDO2-lipid IV(A) lauroyltransferase n=1 Tax=Methylobacterium persicinum TaxID=374426 RepID=A0ABU0HPI2_9HYPH|nr:hypothetical protein [Methylobacterium persicinum]MDQ0444229.1 KDO2-lipid IV(A) lauroyltransferase [Methylobacterium persicinum]GJE39615.1 hypothetical protein KHHGKMAE_3699 [Methylobacterium persicinum]
MSEIPPSRLLAASLPLPVRRHGFRTVWPARRILRGKATLGLAPVFEGILRLSRAEARRLDAEALFADRLVQLEWLALLRRSHRAIRADMRSVAIPDAGLIASVAAGAKPVLLAPLHMGCFALPFAALIDRFFPGRPMLILRAREDRPVETAVMRRIGELGVDMRFLNVRNRQDFLGAIRFARAGATIVSFIDLPASYGAPFQTTLFGRPVQLALGIDQLARLTEATVLPLAITSSLGGDVIHAGRPFEVADNAPDTRRQVADIVRRHIERSILRAPEQWFMWPRLDEYLHDAETSHNAMSGANA